MTIEWGRWIFRSVRSSVGVKGRGSGLQVCGLGSAVGGLLVVGRGLLG